MNGFSEVVTFAALVEEYTDYVYSVAYRLLGNADDARDIAQVTFLKLHKSLGRRDPNKSVKNWICTIAINTSRDVLRSRRHEQGQVSFEDELGHGCTVEERENDARIDVQRVLAGLTGNYRIAVVLFYMEQKSVREIAEIMRSSQVAVKVWLFRARKMMLDMMVEPESPDRHGGE